jgi:ubiquinone/menaquinone biosynthesis C-methylase UbiE
MFHRDGPTFFELARQALSSTQRGYDLLAPKFDFTPFRTPDAILELVVERLKPLRPFPRILDVCCGTGAAMNAMMPLCGEEMVGLDFSEGMLNVAKQDVKPPTDKVKIEFVQKEVMTMDFCDEFDLVVSFGAFGHVLPRDEADFVKRIAKALRSGGKFAFVTSEMPSKLGATYWLARSFNAAMHLRNFLIRPHFVMFYLTFLWPNVGVLLRENQLDVKVFDLFPNEPKLKIYKLIVAEKR